MTSYLRRKRVPTRDTNLGPLPNWRWRSFINWLFDSLTPSVPVVSTVLLMALLMGLSWFPVAWADLNDGLVAYYPFDGNANDESGNGNDGTVNGATLTEDRFGNADSAYMFDGSNDYIDAPANFNDTTFTIGAWIKLKAHQCYAGIVDGYHNKWEFIMDCQGGKKLEFAQWKSDGGYNDHRASSTLNTSQWFYVVVVIDNTSGTFYIDGQLDSTFTMTAQALTPISNFMIGVSLSGSAQYFNGNIDDIRIYNRTLSDCEIKSLYTGKDECIPQTACQLYGVHDQGLNNTQFFTVSPETFEVKALGEMRKAHDIEALDIHPQTAELFAASGKDTKIKGHLYQLNAQTGALTSIGSTGFKEIDGLSFHPDGTLWGWATGDGLVTIDFTTGQANLVAAYPGEIEDLTWNTAGTILFGIENLRNNPDAGVKLLAYDGNTVETVCEELTQSLEIEALDTLPDDTLLFGIHNKTSLPLGAIDVTTCQIIAKQEIATDYNDVEGLAWSAFSCSL